jgi:hypothetical protein
MHLRRGRRAGVRRERMWLIVCSTHFDNGKSAALADTVMTTCCRHAGTCRKKLKSYI